MPAVKPKALSKRHETKEERGLREARERAVTPKTEISIAAPALLKGHKTATAVWKNLIGLYLETDGQIVTAFDAHLLAKFCLLEEECVGMEALRDKVLKEYEKVSGQVDKIKPNDKTLKDYVKLLEQKVALIARYQGLDARLDGKRKFLVDMSRDLYLTPRSRAGAAPQAKDVEPDNDPMEDILNS